MNYPALIDQFVADVCAGKSNETPTAYRTKLKRLAMFLGDRPLDAQALNDFRIHLLSKKTHYRGLKLVDGGLSVYTVRSVLVTVRHFCRWLYEYGLTQTNLTRFVKIPKLPRRTTPKAIEPETAEAIISAAAMYGEKWQQARNYAILLWLRDTGGRISGVLNATIDKIDWEGGRLETVEKGQDSKAFLNPPTIDALRTWMEYRAKLNPKTNHIFISGKTGEKLTRSAVYGIIRALSVSYNVQGRKNPHAFRHAFARDFLQNGGELSQLSQIMGHSSITVTMSYAVWDTRELQQAHRKYSPGNKNNP